MRGGIEMGDDRKKQLAEELLAGVDKFVETISPKGWSFDPQHAVDLLFSVKGEDFKFEKAVYLYLFFIWCIKPNLSNGPAGMRAIAASIALNLTHQATVKHQTLKGARFKGCGNLRRRLEKDWYQEFDRKFIAPVGGLANALNAPSLPSEDRLRKDVYAKRSREIAIVDYIAKVLSAEPKYATRARVREAFKQDVLCKGKAFYKPVGYKRSRAIASAAKRGEEKPVIEKTAFDRLWDGAPKSIVLLYVFQNIIGPDTQRFFSEREILKRLDSDKQFLTKIRKALQLYELICRGFKQHAPGTKAANNWRPVRVPNCSSAVLPKLTARQRKRFETFKKQRPAKTAGSRGQ